jgi:hypothetical protein
MFLADDPQFSQRHNLMACALKDGIKAATRLYECSRNAARKKGSRGYKSPADILATKAPQISPRIFLLHPVPLESLLPKRVTMYRGAPIDRVYTLYLVKGER